MTALQSEVQEFSSFYRESLETLERKITESFARFGFAVKSFQEVDDPELNSKYFRVSVHRTAEGQVTRFAAAREVFKQTGAKVLVR